MLLFVCIRSGANCATIILGPLHNTGNCGVETIKYNVLQNGSVIESQDIGGTVNPGGDLQQMQVTKCGSGTNIISFQVWTVTSGFGSAGNSVTNTYGDGGQMTGTLDSTIDCKVNCLATNTTYAWNVVNNGNDLALFWVTLDGVRQCGTFNIGGGTGMGIELGPGQSGTLVTPPELVGCAPYGNSGNYQLYEVNPLGNWNDGGNCSSPNGPNMAGPYSPTSINPGTGPGGAGSGAPTTVGGGTGATGGGAGSGTTGTIYQNTNQSPIVFNPTNSPGGSNPPTDGTMQEGFAALYDAINRNGAAIVGGVAAVKTELEQHRAIFNGMSNQLGQINGDFGNVTNALVSATNLLTQVTNSLKMELILQTNGFVGVSNSVVNSGQAITNWLSWEVASNLANANLLTNALRGVSNAVVWSGTNQGVFLSNAFYSVMSGLTNLGGSGTNAFSDNGITNSVNNLHGDLTNELTGYHHDDTNYFSGMLGALSGTNGGGSNFVSGDMVPLSATNGDAALSAGNAASSAAQGAADAAQSAIGSPPSLGSGSMPGMHLTLGSASFDISPEAIAPGISSALKAMLTMICLLGFALSAGKLFWEASQTYAAAQTGGVPNLEGELLGFGGNLVGLVVAIAVPVIFIGLWVLVFTGLFSLATGFLSQLVSSSLSLPDGNAMQILTAVFPVDLMLSLAWTRVVLHFAMAKLVIVSASASRYLFGR